MRLRVARNFGQNIKRMTLTNPINTRTSAGRRVALIFAAAEHHCGLRVCDSCGDWLGLARELAEGAITREVCPACVVQTLEVCHD